MAPGVAAALVAAGDTLTTPLSVVPVHRRQDGRPVTGHFHGAATRVPVESTAFGIRREHLVVEIVEAWEPGDATPHRRWADSVADALADDALPGGCPGMLGSGDREQTADAYGPNSARLPTAKRRFDPDQVFSASPLPPATLSAD
jgi:Berberine and berberine like